MKTTWFIRSSFLCTLGSVVLPWGLGCGAAPPTELQQARVAYDRASRGPAAQANPAGLHAAKRTLDAAEAWYAAEGDTQETRDIAYAAERRAETAEAHGRATQTLQERDKAIAALASAKAADAQRTGRDLQRTQEQLGLSAAELQSERQRRLDAEAREAAALSKVASVSREPRGMVITLSGSLLFASGKSELLPSARNRLSQVAATLRANAGESSLSVEGHADARGNATLNAELAERRARTVREFLVSEGIPADRIVAAGFGSERPVATNDTAEGRANNRRVEIVVKPKPSP